MIDNLYNRINLTHTHNLNRLMPKIFATATALSVLQDIILYFFSSQIELKLLLTNAIFMLFLTLSSYILFDRSFNPKLLGVYNVLVCISYIAFTLANYDFSPSMLMFVSFNIIAASIYLDLKGYIFVSVFSLAEIIYFSHFPAYTPQGEFWVEVGMRAQVIIFVSLFCYGVFRPSQLLITKLLEQEIQTMHMAHELRNPLTTVKGFLQMMAKSHTIKEASFELVIEELDRANSIINEYMTLYKPHAKNFNYCNINEIISEVIALTGIQDHHLGIDIEKQFDLSLPYLSLDVNQIKQVFINLMNNSIQAIGHDGKILIQSCFDKVENNIVIIIQDSGPGFPVEMLNKDFTPFFTTKQDGNGLGLLVCQKIIKSHGGKIEIGNNQPKGSYVTISLPIIKKSETA